MPLPKEKSKIDNNKLTKSMLLYGDPKVGKSTFVAKMGTDINKVLFFPTEPGHKFLEIYEWQTEGGGKPKTWEDFKKCCQEFAGSPEFSTLAIDTASILINWCVQSVLKRHGVVDESQGRFGNIFREISREFQDIINKLGQINKGIIFISHVNLKKEKEGMIYPDLPDKYENLFNGMVDYIFYMYTDANGKRFIRTKGTDRIVAGDRSGKLPEIIAIDLKENETKTTTQGEK
jgi:AAA domain